MRNIFKATILLFLLSMSLFAEFSSDYYNGLNYMYGKNRFDTNKNKNIDYKKSKKYFESSIKKYPKTDIESYFYLGVQYQYGYGVQKDDVKALELYKLGAKLKDSSAMFAVANAYRNGQGVKENVELATVWYEKCIALGNLGAMANLGIIYENGEGNVHMNKVKAYKYWSRCAKSDNYFPKAVEMCQSKLSYMCKENPWACK